MTQTQQFDTVGGIQWRETRVCIWFPLFHSADRETNGRTGYQSAVMYYWPALRAAPPPPRPPSPPPCVWTLQSQPRRRLTGSLSAWYRQALYGPTTGKLHSKVKQLRPCHTDGALIFWLPASCSICDNTHTRALPKLGHIQWIEWLFFHSHDYCRFSLKASKLRITIKNNKSVK